MTYRVVKIEPCENGPYICSTIVNREAAGQRADHYTCYGCRGDGTRMVDVAVVEPDDWSDVGIPKPVWVEVESNAVKGPQPVPEFPHVDDEPDEEET